MQQNGRGFLRNQPAFSDMCVPLRGIDCLPGREKTLRASPQQGKRCTFRYPVGVSHSIFKASGEVTDVVNADTHHDLFHAQERSLKQVPRASCVRA